MPKYAKGDYVVHPGQGVCAVEGVIERQLPAVPPSPEPESASDSHQPPASTLSLLYELYPASGPRMRICFPVANEGQLREPVNAREARKLIAQMPGFADDAFNDQHSWAIEEHFMLEVRTGDCRGVLQTLKTMHGRLEEARLRGKKPSVCYDRIYKAAHERATIELSLALNATPEEVERMIADSFKVACA